MKRVSLLSLIVVALPLHVAAQQWTASGSITANDSTQTDRMLRDGASSWQPLNKACPGPLHSSTVFHYDVNPFSIFARTSRFSIQLTSGCDNEAFASFYMTSYDPTNFCSNYLGDMGNSGPLMYSTVQIPSFTDVDVVVNEIDSGVGCSSYTIYVTAEGANALVRADFNGDALSDIPLQDTSGNIAEWWLNNMGSVSAGYGVANPGSTWRVVATGDFDGDGKADMILQDTSTGDIAEWLMDGATVKSGAIVASPGTDWKVVGTTDFIADDFSDLILRNSTTGAIAIWKMYQATITGGYIVGTPGPAWQFVGAGDFNFDSVTDILLQNSTTGEIAEWQLQPNPSALIAAGAVIANPGPSWKVAAVGDFNSDGRTDIILQNTSTSDVAEWQMNGFAVTAGAIIGTPSGYTVMGSVQFSHVSPNVPAIVLRDGSSGNIALWSVDGTTFTGGVLVGSPGASYSPIVR